MTRYRTLLLAFLLPIWLAGTLLLATKPTTTRAAQPEANPKSVALLFLIDESSSINGTNCGPGYNTTNVPIDTQGSRYQLVKFYLSLLSAYYISANNTSNEFPPPPPLQVGVSRFATTYDPILPLTPVLDLELHRSDKSRSTMDRLSHLNPLPREPLADGGGVWACSTQFEKALNQAMVELEATGAEQQILVLWSDGIFHGKETDRERDQNRTPTGEALRNMKAKNLHVYAYLWNRYACRDNPALRSVPECLPDTELYNMRENDMTSWSGWQDDGYLILLENDPFRDLATQLGHLLPSGGWLPTERASRQLDGEHSPIDIPGDAGKIDLYVVYTNPDHFAENIHVSNGEQNLAGRWFVRGVWHYDFVEYAPPGRECMGQPWEIHTSFEAEQHAFYWVVPKYQSAAIQTFTIPAPIILNQSPEFSTIVTFDQGSIPSNANCFEVRLESAALGISQTLPLPADGVELIQSYSTPLTLAWGDYDISTEILRVGPYPQTHSTPVQAKVKVRYMPLHHTPTLEISAPWIEMQQEEEGLLTITIPFSYGARIPAEFPPEFTFTRQDNTEAPIESCLSSEKIREHYKYRPHEKGDTRYYVFELDYSFLNPVCNYRQITIKWALPDIEEIHVSYTFNPEEALCPPPCNTIIDDEGLGRILLLILVLSGIVIAVLRKVVKA